ncbi:MAG: hypothetical protein OHK0039_26040 [Bacteroidia bacterium]
MSAIVYVVASILLVMVSQLMFKKGIMLHSQASVPDPKPGKVAGMVRMMFRPLIFGGLALNGFAAVFWLLALSRLELSYIFPFLSLNYILIPAAAAIFLNEKLSRNRQLGIAIICCGIVLVALSGM